MPKIYNNCPTLCRYVQEGESPEGTIFTDEFTSAGGGTFGELKAKY